MSSLVFHGRASRWLECLPLGDGRLGVMTDGGVSALTLHLNDGTAWSGSPASELAQPVPDAGACAALLARARAAIAAGDPRGAEAPLQAMQTRYAQSYLPLGTVRLDAAHLNANGLAPDAAGLVRELDLLTGMHYSRNGDVKTRTFVSAQHSVLVHVIEPAVPVQVSLRSRLRGPTTDEPEQRQLDAHTHALLLRLPADVAPGHEPDLPAVTWSDGRDTLEAAIVARVAQTDTRTVVLVSTATTFAGPGEMPRGTAEDALTAALARVDAAASESVDALAARSENRMREILGTVTLSFGNAGHSRTFPAPARDTSARLAAARADPRGILASDPGLAALLFEYGRYLLVSCSQPGGLPATLQGLWNDQLQPPWGSGYTLNINTEMNYWGAHVTDLSASARPLTDFTLALARRAATQTRRLYDTPGWTVHHNSDVWLYATTPGRGAGDPRWSFWPLGGAWLAALLTEPAEFGAAPSSDLSEIWTALRGAAEFGLAWHRDGSTSPATSPENAYVTADGHAASLAAVTAMDLSLLRLLFARTVRTAHALGLDRDEVALAASDRLGLLPPAPPIAPDGGIVEWDIPRTPEDPHHRHVSPLFGLFPGTEPWDAAHREAAARTLERRGDDSSGWSLVWKMALWARLGRGDKISPLLALLFRDADDVTGPWAGGLYANLFASHPPFQIDANLGYVAALAETLLQSHDGIHLLPALPAELASGRACGLIARPGIRVDIEWESGVLVRASLRARPAAAGRYRVRWNDRCVTVSVTADHDTVLDATTFDSGRLTG